MQFLEAKGLTPAEIDIALKQAASFAASQAPYSNAYGPNHYPYTSRWDWRDYFVSVSVQISNLCLYMADW